MEIATPTPEQTAIIEMLDGQFLEGLERQPDQLHYAPYRSLEACKARVGNPDRQPLCTSRTSQAPIDCPEPPEPSDGSVVAAFSGEIVGDAVETLKRLATEMEAKRATAAAQVRTLLVTGKLTKTERRILARGEAQKLAAQPWIELSQYQKIRSIVKANKTGSYVCTGCGKRLSRNKACGSCGPRPNPYK